MFANRFYWTSIFTLFIFTSSCGYSLQGSGSVLPSDVKTVAIPVAENETTEAGLGQRFTESLRSRFDRYGAVKVVDTTREADAVFTTKIVKAETRVREVTSSTDISLASDLIMTVSAELRRKNGQLLYRNPSLTVSQPFAGVGDVVVTSSSSFAQGGIQSGDLSTLGANEVARGQAQQAMEDMLEEMSRRLYLDAVAADF